MMFKKGDRVKFLNDTGGGLITRVEQKTAYVENEDGFEIPVSMSQLLPAAVAQAEASPFTKISEQAPSAEISVEIFQPVVEQAPDYIDLTGEPDESNIDSSVNILLAWLPQRTKDRKTTCNLYLVNDCSYHIMYVAAMIREGAYRGLQAGMLECDTTIHLAQITEADLKHISSIRLELLFFKKGACIPQEPIRYELKIDEFYLMDAVNYLPNEYFDEKALIYNVTEEHLMAEIENVAHEVQMQFVKQKQQIDKPVSKPAKKTTENDTEEVDLHIEQLLDNPKAFSSAEMLEIQTNHFAGALDDAIRNRKKRIVFIHGVGNGRLRQEIQRILIQKYPKLRYQDASFREYGYGATMVFLSNNPS